MSSSTVYQSAILQDDNRTPSTSTHVRYTSAEPFTPKFVKDHLTTSTTKKSKLSSSSRAQALYDERVRRRQVGLVPRRGANADARKKEKKKEKKGVKREKMGRREAAEMGIWRLRDEEARCVVGVLLDFLHF
jgi:ribonuclease P protein subunit POP4